MIKFRTKLGGFEFDYEGTEAFLKTEASGMLDKIVSAFTGLPDAAKATAISAGNMGPPAAVQSSGVYDYTTNTIASISDVKSGPDLAMAAAAHLALVKGQDKFSRKSILEEMQNATTYYNQNYSGNLSKMLIGLTKGKRLNLVGTQMYALTKAERDGYEARLAQPA